MKEYYRQEYEGKYIVCQDKVTERKLRTNKTARERNEEVRRQSCEDLYRKVN